MVRYHMTPGMMMQKSPVPQMGEFLLPKHLVLSMDPRLLDSKQLKWILIREEDIELLRFLEKMMRIQQLHRKRNQFYPSLCEALLYPALLETKPTFQRIIALCLTMIVSKTRMTLV